MKNFILLLAVSYCFTTVTFAKTLLNNNFITPTSIEVVDSSVKVTAPINITTSTKSNIQFNIMNNGMICQDTSNIPGLQWPRNSKNYYIFGGGLWFGAQKNVNGTLNKLCLLSYNPNSATSWFQPSIFTSVPDSASLQQTRVFRSTDFIGDGTPIQNGFAANWLIWDTDPLASLYVDGYFGNMVSNPTIRNKNTFPKGPAIVSDEDIVTVFDDQNINKYEGGNIDALIKQGYPVNIQVIQRVFSWSSEEFKDAIIVEQKITNTGKDTLYKCALAPMFDYDIAAIALQQGASNDKFRYLTEDTTLNLALMWSDAAKGIEAGRGFGYMGIGFVRTPAVDNQGYLLSDNIHHSRGEQLGATNIQSTTIVNDPGLNGASLYDFITQNYIDTEVNGASDRRFYMSTSGFNLLPHETATFAYIICFAKPSVKPEADGSASDVQGVVNLFKKTRAFYDSGLNKNTLGVENSEKTENGIQVYPNPTNNRLFVQLPDEYREANVSLFTLLGNKVANVEQGSNGAFIDVSMLSAGMYVVRVELQSGVNVTIPVAVIH